MNPFVLEELLRDSQDTGFWFLDACERGQTPDMLTDYCEFAAYRNKLARTTGTRLTETRKMLRSGLAA
jgi:hypothetical protein